MIDTARSTHESLKNLGIDWKLRAARWGDHLILARSDQILQKHSYASETGEFVIDVTPNLRSVAGTPIPEVEEPALRRSPPLAWRRILTL